MKLLSLTICNYKNYCGKQHIDLDISDPKKNLTLIGGQNGAGKTTLFEAIKLCMFGYQYEGKPIVNTEYQGYLRSCQNKNSVAADDTEYYIEMVVVLDDVQPVYTVTLRRTWTITENSFDEEFVILQDGRPFEIVEKENWQQYIYDMFPPYTIEYFFFDGEKMRDLILGSRAESLLRDSARDLIGLKVYDTLLSDVGVLKERIKKSTAKDDKTREEYHQLENEISTHSKKLHQLEEEKEKLDAVIADADARIDFLREEIHRKAGAFAKESDTNEAKIKALKASNDMLNVEIAKMTEYLPFMMVQELMQDALTQLEREKFSRECQNNAAIVETVRKLLLDKLHANKRVVETVNQTLNEYAESILTDSTFMLHDVTNATFMQFSEFLKGLGPEQKTAYLSLLKEREEKGIELQKLYAAKRTLPDQSFVEMETLEIEQKKELIAASREKIEKIIAEIGSLRPVYEEKIKQLDEIDLASLKLVEDKSKYAACEKLEAILQDYISYTLTTKVQLLEDTISSMYLKLENKDDLVEKIKLDPMTFDITLYGFDGNIVNKNTLSSGEKEIFALSILWGLSQLSKSHLPIVVDSLLARLDESHVRKVAECFLPNAGDQVLILSHNREVNKPMRKLLLPWISKEYLLSYDQRQKISEGYFKECM